MGESGIGKSHFARHHWGYDVYIKGNNSWWGKYNKQKVVLRDDVTCIKSEDMFENYKCWADKYHVNGEIKGKHEKSLSYDYFICTSNYTIEEAFA